MNVLYFLIEFFWNNKCMFKPDKNILVGKYLVQLAIIGKIILGVSSKVKNRDCS